MDHDSREDDGTWEVDSSHDDQDALRQNRVIERPTARRCQQLPDLASRNWTERTPVVLMVGPSVACASPRNCGTEWLESDQLLHVAIVMPCRQQG
jgi:hypothetical protein